jgi:hypothetical protein
MSPTQIERDLLPKITDAMIAKCISDALCQQHTDVHSAMKQIERITGINASTASNWYKGRYAPKSNYLLMLAAHYPEVLKVLCKLIGMELLWQQAISLGLVKNMHTKLNKKWNRSSAIGDKFVPIHVRVDACIAVQLNQRQLWFLGHLQQGAKMIAADIVKTWHVHAKTARRDVKGLLEAKLIVAIKTGRIKRYELL